MDHDAFQGTTLKYNKKHMAVDVDCIADVHLEITNTSINIGRKIKSSSEKETIVTKG